MGPFQEDLGDFAQFREWLEKRLEKVDEILREGENERQSICRTLSTVGEYEQAILSDHIIPSAPRVDSKGDSGDSGYPDLAALPINVDGARNLLERIIRIAEATGGVIHTVRVAEYLVATGHSKSKVANLRAHVHDVCANSEFFIKNGKNFFKRLPESGELLTGTGSESATALL